LLEKLEAERRKPKAIMDADEIRQSLATFIARESGASEVTVEGLRRLPGGASRETWSFDATLVRDGARESLDLVLRRDRADSLLATGRRDEFLLLRALRERAVPVPRVYWLGDEVETLGARFFVMQRVQGETLARRLLRDEEYANARGVMTAQLGEILARIHGVDCSLEGIRQLPGVAEEGKSLAEAEVDRYEALFRAIAPEPHPAFELAFRWLRRHLPPTGRRTVVHGDYRIGNVIFGPEGVRSILDWELAHLGDPMEDLGWLCVRSWRFGSDHKPVGGIGEREQLFEAYAKAGGGSVDPAHVRFWEVFGNLKWACICIGQAKTHLDGAVFSVELASLGRRTAETELELLNLIER
jgi:aminoglycoside phosphotransferase (APT) family kinase protein